MRWRHQLYAYCPRCGARYQDTDFDPLETVFRCGRCAFASYQNSVPSATAVIPHHRSPAEVLLLTRNNEPGRGLLALPGGFLRHDEQPSEAALREAREETGLAITIDRLLCATLVRYPYDGALLSVLEIAFLAHPIEDLQPGIRTDEAQNVGFFSVSRVLADPTCLAFPEQARALHAFASLGA